MRVIANSEMSALPQNILRVISSLSVKKQSAQYHFTGTHDANKINGRILLDLISIKITRVKAR